MFHDHIHFPVCRKNPAILTKGTQSSNLYRTWRLTFHSVGGEEGQVFGLERVFVGELGSPGLGLRLSGQGGVVHLYKGKEEILF